MSELRKAIEERVAAAEKAANETHGALGKARFSGVDPKTAHLLTQTIALRRLEAMVGRAALLLVDAREDQP